MILTKTENNLISAEFKSGIFPVRLNVFLYIADGVLIDAGPSNILKKTIPFIRNKKINCAAITHIHEDHTGAAAWIKENLKIPVYLHKNSITEASVKSDIALYRKITWGNRDAFTADPMPEFIETEKYRFEVIDTPGHHKEHVAFYERNMGWIFTGDLYVARKQAVAFKDENINDAINSITEILSLDFDTILCGHSGIHKKGKEKFKAKLDFFLGIKEQVNSLRDKGLSAEEINKCLFPKKNLWEFVSRGEWSTMNIIRTI